MAAGMYLNFEKLSAQIVEAEIAQMHDDIVLHYDDEPDEIDEDAFLHNLYHGAIAYVFIVNMYETALNTILGKRLGCADFEVLKATHAVKLSLICAMYHLDIQKIKGRNEYSILKKTIKIRNDITHFKSNELLEGHIIPIDTMIPLGSSNEPVSIVFTKKYLANCWDGVLRFLKYICEQCGLVVNMECAIIDNDGRDMACEFIITKETYYDSERFME